MGMQDVYHQQKNLILDPMGSKKIIFWLETTKPLVCKLDCNVLWIVLFFCVTAKNSVNKDHMRMEKIIFLKY
jgi:hypothetical protein